MPGATDTHFFARADMLDTKVGAGKKDDPADVAKAGFKAMMEGKGDVVCGFEEQAVDNGGCRHACRYVGGRAPQNG
jgi:short-subunit dehydrogenase